MKQPSKYASGGVIAPGEKFVPGNIYDPNPTAGLAVNTGESMAGATTGGQTFDLYGGGNEATPTEGRTPGTATEAELDALGHAFGMFAGLTPAAPFSTAYNTVAAFLGAPSWGRSLAESLNTQGAINSTYGGRAGLSEALDAMGPLGDAPMSFSDPVSVGGPTADAGFGESNTDAQGNYGDQAFGGYNTGSNTTEGGYTGQAADGNTGNAAEGGGGPAGPSDSSSGDYATGGMVGLPPQRPTQAPPTLQQLRGGRPQAATPTNPAAQQRMKAMLQQGLQSGTITPQTLKMGEQLCVACLQNPALYPNLRNFAIQRGLVKPNTLPPQFDQRLVTAILSALRLAEGQPEQGVVPPAGMGEGNGGQLFGPGTGTSDSIPARNMANGGEVKVSTGEYIIPERVVRAKGKDFFDSLIRKYSEVPQ